MIDPARMDRSRMVDRYLAHELSAEEVAAFEEFLLEHPETQAEIDAARRMKLGLARLREKGELQALVAGGSRWSGARLALAASVVLAVAVGTLYLARTPTMLAVSLDAFAAKQSSRPAAEVTFVRTRDAARQVIQTPAEGQLLALSIHTDMHGPETTFEVRIAREGEEEPKELLAELEDLRSDSETLSVYFDARAAGAGDYRITVDYIKAGLERYHTDEYLLTVRPETRP